MILTEFPVPNDGVHHKEDNVQTYIDGNLTGTGSLYIAESQLTWLSAGGEGGFCLEYPKIALHAVSRDITSFPQPCLYLQVEGKLIDDDNRSSSSEEGEGEPNEEPMSEVRFVPADNVALEGMFTAMSNCQILHPDPEEVDYDEDVDDEYFEGEEGGDQLTEEGQINLERFEAMLRQGQGDGPSTNGNVNGNAEAEDAEPRGPGDGGQFDDADMEQ